MNGRRTRKPKPARNTFTQFEMSFVDQPSKSRNLQRIESRLDFEILETSSTVPARVSVFATPPPDLS